MAKKSVVSGGLFAKLGAQLVSAHETHKVDETDYGSGGELPAGIELGVAQLTDCKFDVYKTGKLQGKYYFYAAGIVVEPKTHTLEGGRVVRVEGLRTSIMEPLCDTPDSAGKKKTFDDHYASILNEIRKLGVDTTQVNAQQIESVLESLASSGLHFGFRTWSGKPTAEYPEPRVTHTWTGACEHEESTADDVVDETPEVLEPTVAAVVAAPAAKKAPVKPGKKAPVAPLVFAPVEPEVTRGNDLESLIALANVDDDAAKLDLAAMAEQVGVSESDIVAAADWNAVGALISAAQSGSSSEEEIDTVALGAAADAGDTNAEETLTAIAVEAGLDPNDGEAYADWKALGVALAGEGSAEDTFQFTVGTVCKYTPAGKTKPVDCEVTYIDAAKQTVNLKDLTNMKPYKGIAFAKISS